MLSFPDSGKLWRERSNRLLRADEVHVENGLAGDLLLRKQWWGQSKPSTLVGLEGPFANAAVVAGFKCVDCGILIFGCDIPDFRHRCDEVFFYRRAMQRWRSGVGLSEPFPNDESPWPWLSWPGDPQRTAVIGDNMARIATGQLPWGHVPCAFRPPFGQAPEWVDRIVEVS